MSSTHQWFAYCSTPLHLSAVVSWSVDRRGGRGGGGRGGGGDMGKVVGGGGSGLLQPEMGLFSQSCIAPRSGKVCVQYTRFFACQVAPTADKSSFCMNASTTKANR